jgi:hypothetical protein
MRLISAVLGVSLRALRLRCHLTQRTVKHAEDAEKIDQLRPPVVSSLVVKNSNGFECHKPVFDHFVERWKKVFDLFRTVNYLDDHR